MKDLTKSLVKIKSTSGHVVHTAPTTGPLELIPVCVARSD